MSKWNENLKKVSESNDINEIPQEWIYMHKTERESRDGHCICGRSHIKHVHFFANIKNNNVIEIGGGCIKKLRLEKINSKHMRAHNKLLKKFNKQGHPIMDVTLPEYIKKVYEHFYTDIKSHLF